MKSSSIKKIYSSLKLIPNNVPAGYFTDMLILKFIWRGKCSRITKKKNNKNILKWENKGRIILSNIKIHSKDSKDLIPTARHCCRIAKWGRNRIEVPKI
jgi:hypothetical protein